MARKPYISIGRSWKFPQQVTALVNVHNHQAVGGRINNQQLGISWSFIAHFTLKFLLHRNSKGNTPNTMKPFNNKIFINDRRGPSHKITNKVRIKMADMAQPNYFNNWSTRTNQPNRITNKVQPQNGRHGPVKQTISGKQCHAQRSRFQIISSREFCKVKIEGNWNFGRNYQRSKATSYRQRSTEHSNNIKSFAKQVHRRLLFPRKLWSPT